jgi:hypothetical protein
MVIVVWLRLAALGCAALNPTYALPIQPLKPTSTQSEIAAQQQDKYEHPSTFVGMAAHGVLIFPMRISGGIDSSEGLCKRTIELSIDG